MVTTKKTVKRKTAERHDPHHAQNDSSLRCSRPNDCSHEHLTQSVSTCPLNIGDTAQKQSQWAQAQGKQKKSVSQSNSSKEKADAVKGSGNSGCSAIESSGVLSKLSISTSLISWPTSETEKEGGPELTQLSSRCRKEEEAVELITETGSHSSTFGASSQRRAIKPVAGFDIKAF